MPKKVPPHFKNQARKCIFCDEPGLSKTHIWPDWLNRLLGPQQIHNVQIDDRTQYSATEISSQRTAKNHQGSLFSRKPYLACIDCNTGWMKWFEDEMAKFSKPIFTSFDPVILDAHQQRVLAGWISLITILAEHIYRAHAAITARERVYIKDNLAPPSHWSIFASSQEGEKWSAHYSHKGLYIGETSGLGEYISQTESNRASRPPANTQISSFGVGHLFVQVFSTPFPRFVADYRGHAVITELTQIWPVRRSLWPFTKRALKFPSDLILTDGMADELADSYAKRIEALTTLPKNVRP